MDRELLDVLLPSAFISEFQCLPIAGRKFDAEETFALMARHGVRNAFLPPTALKMMRQVPKPREGFAHRLRSVTSGGGSARRRHPRLLPRGLWGRGQQFYGQTEANLHVGNSASLCPVRPCSMGRATPGDVSGVLEQPGGDSGKIRRRLALDR
jgi:acetyl-CoA synthetase